MASLAIWSFIDFRNEWIWSCKFQGLFFLMQKKNWNAGTVCYAHNCHCQTLYHRSVPRESRWRNSYVLTKPFFGWVRPRPTHTTCPVQATHSLINHFLFIITPYLTTFWELRHLRPLRCNSNPITLSPILRLSARWPSTGLEGWKFYIHFFWPLPPEQR